DETPFLYITLEPSPEAPKKSKKQNRRRVRSQPEPSLKAPKDAKPSPLHSDFESSVRSLDFKMFDNNVPTTAKVLAKNLQAFSSFLYAQLFEENWAKHEEVAAFYANLKAAVEGYYKENVDHRAQIDKLVKNTMDLINR
ncbi:hypothetical protein Tco_0447279, partial [Tanacetum coccineum]